MRPAESPPPSTEAALPVLPDGGSAPPPVTAPFGN
jgi:hypothetical protein